MAIDELIILGSCIVVGLNLYATYRVLRSHWFERSQKIAKTIVIWILSIVGAVLMLYFSDEDDDSFGPGSSYGGGHDISSGEYGGGAD